MKPYNHINTDYDVNICYAYVSDLDIDEKEISEYRKKKLKAIKTESARKQSLGAEAVLIANIRKNVSDAVFPLKYEADKNGKPEFVNACDIHFSLSHSKNIAVCAIAQTPVGVDVQEIKEPNLKIAEKYFTQNELSLNDGSDSWFMHIWSRKEAVAKAEGTGISIGLSKIDVSSNNVILNGEKYYVQDIAIQDKNYCMAVAVKISD